MHEFPSNSAKARAQSEAARKGERREKVERVTSAEAVRRKKRLGSRFKETLIDGTPQMAFEYMLVEVIVPAIQNTMIDAFQGGIERLIKGESRRRPGSRTTSYSDVGHFNYQSVSSNRPPTSDSSRRISRRSRSLQTFDEIVIPSRVEAEEVLDRMFELLSRYGMVTVSELYEMTGIASAHTDHKWGWTSLPGAKVVRMRTGGFLLDLPEPQALSA